MSIPTNDVAGFRFWLRAGTTAEWLAADPVLGPGEPGVDLDRSTVRFGDGVRLYSELDELGPVDTAAILGRLADVELGLAGVTGDLSAETVQRIAGDASNATNLDNLSYALADETQARVDSYELLHKAMRAGHWYGSQPAGGTTTAVLAAGTLHAVPIWVPRDNTVVDQLAVNVSAGAAGATLALSLYWARSTDGYPTNRIAGGTVDASTTGAKSVTIGAVPLYAGWHWMTCLALGGAPTLRVDQYERPLVSETTLQLVNPRAGYVLTGLGANPAPFTAGALTVGAAARLLMRVQP